MLIHSPIVRDLLVVNGPEQQPKRRGLRGAVTPT